MCQRLGHVSAAVTEADVVGLVVDGAGEKENAGLLNDGFAELEDVLLQPKLNEADRTGVRRSPGENFGMTNEESRKQAEIAKDELAIAFDNFLAMTEGEVCQELAGGAAADRCVVLEAVAEF